MLQIRSMLRSNRGFIALLLMFGLLRTAVADYNPVPSGSMRPTILEGDVVLVNRLAYDLKFPLTRLVLARLGEPRRGDIVTFDSPKDGTRLIKRVVGLPGDVIEMESNRLRVNGVAVQYVAQGHSREELSGREITALREREELAGQSHDVQWLEGIQSRSSFGPVAVPEDQYLMLGDNRDNSADSRYIGLVKRSLLIARAERVLVSADISGSVKLRLERFGMSLYQSTSLTSARAPGH